MHYFYGTIMSRITICELPDFEDSEFESQFEALVDHAAANNTDLVVLPEMPFAPWLSARDPSEADCQAKWEQAADSHEEWIQKLDALDPATVIGSRPVIRNGRRLNEGFVYQDGEVRGVHLKGYLPDDPGFEEASWYDAGTEDFDSVECAGLTTGMLICTDVWASHEVRRYHQLGVDVLVNPRVAPRKTNEEWLAGARTMSMLAGAYLASSNRSGAAAGVTFGGSGWLTSPNGEVLARTNEDHPFITVEVDRDIAEHAKSTYPRDALDRTHHR